MCTTPSRTWFSEKGPSQSSATLSVPRGSYSIDVADFSSTTTNAVDLRQKSASPPPPPSSPMHSRTGSFDLHDIEPPSTSASPKKTWRSISAQPEFDSDTTPLVDHTTTSIKHSSASSLRRKNAIKRASTKSQFSSGASKGNKELKAVSKSLSKSSSDLREISDKPHKSHKKPPTAKRTGYWISMVDGFQRIILFTPQYSVVKNCEKANMSSFDALEVNFSLRSLSITLIDNNTHREILLLSILP